MRALLILAVATAALAQTPRPGVNYDEAKVGKSQQVVSSDHHVVNFKVKVAQVILVHGVEGSTELCEHASQQLMISDWSRFAD